MKIVYAVMTMVLVVMVACGGAKNNLPPAGSGEVSAKLSLIDSSETLTSVGYTLSNGSNVYTGTGTLGAGNSFTISNIAPGSDYRLALLGETTDDLATCSGLSNPFLVQTDLTSNVLVELTCTLNSAPTDGGAVSVQVNTQNCPSVNPLVADSTTVLVGGSTNIAASASGPSVSDLTYTWSIQGTDDAGTPAAYFGSTPDANATMDSEVEFVCPATPETDTVQVLVSDGADCFVSTSITIHCQM
jgi:hypothetical protein